MQIIGHQTQRNLLKILLKEDRLPHAILLCGNAGIGKRLIALEIAEEVLTRSLTSEDIISKEKALDLITAGEHPDLYFLSPKENKKSIGVEDVRDLQERLALTPYYRTGACIIIEDAEKMSIQASNCLLKTLEEPAENRYFILISSCPHLLPPTVLSRSQKLLLGTLKPNEILEILNALSENSISEQDSKNIADILNGSLELLSLSPSNRLSRTDHLKKEKFTLALEKAREIHELSLRFSNIYKNITDSKRFISEITHILSLLEKDDNFTNSQIIIALNAFFLSALRSNADQAVRLNIADKLLSVSKKWEEIKSRNLNLGIQITDSLLSLS